MSLLRLALRSLWSRRGMAAITAAVIALSSGLLFAQGRARSGLRKALLDAAGGGDLVVGAPGSRAELVLGGLMGIGGAPPLMRGPLWSSLEEHPRVAWLVPIALGDSIEEHRVVATQPSFFKHWPGADGAALRFRAGGPFAEASCAVLGASAAHSLGLQMGAEVRLTHGTGEEGPEHDAALKVCGVLEPTAGPLDRWVVVPLAVHDHLHEEADPLAGADFGEDAAFGDEELLDEDHDGDHDDHDEGGHGNKGRGDEGDDSHDEDGRDEKAHDDHDEEGHDEGDHDNQEKEGHTEDGHDEDDHDKEGHGHDDHADEVPDINLAIVGLHSKAFALLARASIEEEGKRAAAVPAQEVARLWESLSWIETGLIAVSLATVVISLLALVLAWLATLASRRDELAVLRAIGARPTQLFVLLWLEGVVVGTLGAAAGLGVGFGGLLLLRGELLARWGLALDGGAIRGDEIASTLALVILVMVSSVPAGFAAYRSERLR